MSECLDCAECDPGSNSVTQESHSEKHRLCSQERGHLRSWRLCDAGKSTLMSAPGDDLEESTSRLVLGLNQGSSWYRDGNQNRGLFTLRAFEVWIHSL